MLFFKKFTEVKAKQWHSIPQKATKEINKKYETQSKPIETKLASKGKDAPSIEDKKKLKAELKQIEDKILAETKIQIKTEFNYQIPIAEVEKAGINSTGGQIENELETLAKEFKTYRQTNQLWATPSKEINYQITDNEIERICIVEGVVAEPEVFYGKSR